MEIGNEIGQKIRSAIRAKLVELGAYVDDELPDYVMVMVANRKSEAQMCEDLSLFLGSNTSKFTAWLHGLLQKLLSITSAEPSATAMEPGKMTAVGSEAQSASQPSTEATVTNPKDAEDFPGTAENQMAKTSKNRGSSASKRKEVTARQRPDAAIEDEPVIRLSLDHDEFEEETRVLSENVKDGTLSKGKGETTRRFDKRGSDGNASRQSEPIKHSSRSSGGQSSRDAFERKSSVPGEGVRGEGRKRHHGLESSVGAVVKHDIDEVDEAYDPLHPAIGSVASVVKVTERKSSVPPSLQANRTLLLLAMKEAEKSVAEFRKSSVSEIETDAAAQGRVKTLSGSVKSSSGKRPETTEQVMAVRQIPLTSSTSQALQEDNRRRRKAPEESGDEENEKAVAVVRGQVLTAETAHRRPGSSESGRNVVLTDETQNQMTAAAEEEAPEEEEQQLRRILIQQRQHLPIERTSSPKFVVTLDGIYQNATSESGDILPVEEEEEDEALSVPQLENVPRNIVRVKPQAQMVEEETENADYDEDDDEFKSLSKKSKVTERCKYWPSCKNGDSCPFHHPSIPCKMFPTCRFGDKCFYLHPSCKFDGICRNPACPYVHSAGRPLSQPLPIIMPIRMPIFSFPSGSIFAPVRQRSHMPTQPPEHVRCRFFPNCTNMNCAFLHPKACRYGLSCASKSSCPFAHPQLPTKKQLKWVSTSASREDL